MGDLNVNGHEHCTHRWRPRGRGRTATGSPAAGSGPFMPPSFRLRNGGESPWRARRGGAAGGPVRTRTAGASRFAAGVDPVTGDEAAEEGGRETPSPDFDFSLQRSIRSRRRALRGAGRTSSCGVRPGWAQRLEPSAGPTSKTRIRPAPLEGEEIGTLRIRPSGAVRLVHGGTGVTSRPRPAQRAATAINFNGRSSRAPLGVSRDGPFSD